jgi:hypothetical protein
MLCPPQQRGIRESYFGTVHTKKPTIGIRDHLRLQRASKGGCARLLPAWGMGLHLGGPGGCPFRTQMDQGNELPHLGKGGDRRHGSHPWRTISGSPKVRWMAPEDHWSTRKDGGPRRFVPGRMHSLRRSGNHLQGLRRQDPFGGYGHAFGQGGGEGPADPDASDLSMVETNGVPGTPKPLSIMTHRYAPMSITECMSRGIKNNNNPVHPVIGCSDGSRQGLGIPS